MKKSKEMQSTQFDYIPHYEVVTWGPKTRLVAAATAFGILTISRQMKGVARQFSSFAGISLGLRALLNRDLTRVIGTLLSPTIRLNREIIVEAPIDVVAAFWYKPENYSRFMSFVRKVNASRHGNLEWEISGPARVPIRWESYVLSWEPAYTIAWRSVPGSPVFNSGKVKFERLEYGSSKVQVELAYAMRAGSLGYALTRILGFDPRTHIDQDLIKMKSLIEEEWETQRASEIPLSG